jgi:Domain of unknown function (DUF2341)/Fibronectin type III domain/FlgD Ig-like domain/Putative Ig domain
MKKLALMAVLSACVGVVSAQPFAAWTKYRNVTINTTSTGGGANVTTAHANFPVLVRLSNASEAAGANVLSEALAGGADLRFTDSTGTVVLAHEIESWSASSATIWVRVPSVAGNANTKLRLYWNRSGVTSTSNASAVFGNNSFLGVWHMGTASGAAARVNAASPGTNDAMPAGTATASMNPTAGVIGMSDSLRAQDGGQESDDHFSMGPMTFPDSQITVSMWVLLPDPQNFVAWNHFFSHGNSNLEDNIWFGRENNTTNLRARGATGGAESGNATSTTLAGGLATLNTWMHLAVSKDSLGGRRWRLYKDGVMAINYYNSADNHRFIPGPRSSNFIGRSLWPDRNSHIKVDEMRTSAIARHPDWMKLEFETQKAAATAVTLGTTVTPAAPALAYITKSATYLVNQAITANTPVTSSAGTGWSIAPALPAGLSFSTTTGAITGTPTAVTASAQYIVTATVNSATVKDTLTISVTTGTPPSAPTGVTATGASGQATVTWTAGAAGSSAITSYVVRAVQDSTKTCTWTTGPLSCVVTGLTNGTSYTFTVRAVSAAGTSPLSAASAAVTPAGVAAAPTNVTAAQAGTAASVTVSWTLPTNNGGSPIVEYYANGTPGGICYAPAPVSGTTGSCVATGLTFGQAYTFRVYAVNGIGNSPLSSPSNAVTPVGLANSFAIQVSGMVKPYTFALTDDAMKSTEALTMSITDIKGRTVWSKTINPSQDRVREVTWNGLSSKGNAVSAGVYMVRLSAVNAGKTSEVVRPTVK